MSPQAVHHFSVRVRVHDSIGGVLAETTVKCQALDPGAACMSAFNMARAEFQRTGADAQFIPRSNSDSAVSFLVLMAKGKK